METKIKAKNKKESNIQNTHAHTHIYMYRKIDAMLNDVWYVNELRMMREQSNTQHAYARVFYSQFVHITRLHCNKLTVRTL